MVYCIRTQEPAGAFVVMSTYTLFHFSYLSCLDMSDVIHVRQQLVFHWQCSVHAHSALHLCDVVILKYDTVICHNYVALTLVCYSKHNYLELCDCLKAKPNVNASFHVKNSCQYRHVYVRFRCNSVRFSAVTLALYCSLLQSSVVTVIFSALIYWLANWWNLLQRLVDWSAAFAVQFVDMVAVFCNSSTVCSPSRNVLKNSINMSYTIM